MVFLVTTCNVCISTINIKHSAINFHEDIYLWFVIIPWGWKTSTTLCWVQNALLENCHQILWSYWLYFEVTPLPVANRKFSSSKTSNGVPFLWCYLNLPRSLPLMITGPASYPRKLLSFPIKRSCLSLGKEILLPTQTLLLESRDLLGIMAGSSVSPLGVFPSRFLSFPTYNNNHSWRKHFLIHNCIIILGKQVKNNYFLKTQLSIQLTIQTCNPQLHIYLNAWYITLTIH